MTIVTVSEVGTPGGSTIGLLAWFENADFPLAATARTRKYSVEPFVTWMVCEVVVAVPDSVAWAAREPVQGASHAASSAIGDVDQ